MKKYLISSLILAISCLSIWQPALAMETDEDGARWWTISELIEMNEEDRETDILDNLTISVTGVNIEENEITVFINREDPMLKRMGISETSEITELELAWTEKDANYSEYLDHVWNGKEMEKLHILYTLREEDEFLDQQETVLKIENADLSENDTNMIRFWLNKSDGGSAMGMTDYGECVNAVDYIPGMDCKMTISEEGRMMMKPFEREVAVEEVPEEMSEEVPEEVNEGAEEGEDSAIENMEEEGSADADDEIVVEEDQEENGLSAEDGIAEGSDNIIENNNQNNNANITDEKEVVNNAFSKNQVLVDEEPNYEQAQNIDQKVEDLDIEVPKLGGSECEEKVSFPWWFLVILGVGDVILVWLWSPKKGKTLKK